MAQKIVTVCDQHASHGEEVPGLTWRLAVQAPGQKLTTYDVDACDDCAKPFVELAQYLGELARPVGKPARAVPVADQDTPESERTCPTCGLVSVNRTAMRTHLRSRHGQTLATVGTDPATAETGLVCPECQDVFGSPQGLGAHRSRSHGVTGTSSGAAAARARKAAAATDA